MVDLSSIIENYKSKYISLDEVRGIIYKSKLDNNKTSGKNEQSFYGVTCAKDTLFLLKQSEEKGEEIKCYVKNHITEAIEESNLDILYSYLEYLIVLDEDNIKTNYHLRNMYEAYCEQKSEEFENEDFYFLRAQIENIIGISIPYFKDISEIAEFEPSKNILIKKQDKIPSPKSETSYLNLIQALKETCLAGKEFKNQDELREYLSHQYQGYIGLSDSNIRAKFAQANKIK